MILNIFSPIDMQSGLVYCLAIVKSTELNIIGRKSSTCCWGVGGGGAPMLNLAAAKYKPGARLMSRSSYSSQNLTGQITCIYGLLYCVVLRGQEKMTIGQLGFLKMKLATVIFLISMRASRMLPFVVNNSSIE
jgi:hypothetical protein